MKLYISSLKQRGNLTYTYSPLHNFQISKDLYQKEGFKIFDGECLDKRTGEILKSITSYSSNNSETIYKNKAGEIVDKKYILTIEHSGNEEEQLIAKTGSLIDFETQDLNFDLEHPVDIEVQPSYDGSVNLILNDNKNIPRLINSRFSVREKNTYEIVDRIGENDTNIYNKDTFNADSALYFQYDSNPIIDYGGLINGNLPVGEYCFYLTYCDADENESDFIAESGPIPVFLGNDKDPFSIDGGIKNQNSNKGIKLIINNLTKSYNYLKVYYVRYFADYQQNRVQECKKLYYKYPINGHEIVLQITGNENAEDIDANILNITKFNPKSLLTQSQCKNMLFFGNIKKNYDDYKELGDCALRIVPSLDIQSFENVNNEYQPSNNGNVGYYNSKNIYYKTGYFNQEFYRFGVVFIYQNGTLSNVYNTLGRMLDDTILNYNIPIYNKDKNVLTRTYIKSNSEGWIIDEHYNDQIYLNNKGVCKINSDKIKNDETIIGIKFNIPINVVEHLKGLGIRGLFFVRQKRIPTLIAQCYTLPIDNFSRGPILSFKDGNIVESFLDNDGYIKNNNYIDRLNNIIPIKDTYSHAGICPDFLLNQPYYNQVFNGSNFTLVKVGFNGSEKLTRSKKNQRIYIDSDSSYQQAISKQVQIKATICSVTEEVPIVAIKDKEFRLVFGEQEEAYKFQLFGRKDTSDTKQTNLVRGKYSPYLAIYSSEPIESGCIYNIYNDILQDDRQNYLDRMNSYEPFYAISNRYNFNNIVRDSTNFILTCWRGDCYINTFTYRLNRNFNDPSLPNNDVIIDQDTWKKNFYKENSFEEDINSWPKISRSDVNAVQLGSWITFKVKSYMNYALRSVDHSYVSEEALMGAPRSFYPRSSLLQKGANKMPDSYLYNDAYRASLGYKCYFTLNDPNYIKNVFSNRIQYSDIAIQDSYKNNYRQSLSTYFRDYSQEYGSITKLVNLQGNLVVIFEHAIGVAVINERILAGTGDGDPVFINTKNVLPEELSIVTDTYGTQWGDSVIKSESGYIYGVDTIAKKIWRFNQQFELLSDLKVNGFLVNNILLEERAVSPIIGIRNVKTHYNNNKKDIMFTFYNENNHSWNLCYNEIMDMFTTFYSWIPSYSANIDTQYFSFDRETSRKLSLLEKSSYHANNSNGILLEKSIIDTDKDSLIKLFYKAEKFSQDYILNEEDGTITPTLNSGTTYESKIQYEVLSKNGIQYKKYKNIIIQDDNNSYINISNSKLNEDLRNGIVIIPLQVGYKDNSGKYYRIGKDTIALTSKKYLKSLKYDFYLHGQSGLMNIQGNTYPCNWYDQQHPFEFEFVVNESIGQQKIFNNLIIVSNKAEPESFHFEIEGDNYEFSSDKRNMYFRQEATKELFQNMGSDILFDEYYTDVQATKYTQEQYYRAKDNNIYKYDLGNAYPVENSGLTQQVKSTLFLLYYEKTDTYNEIYHTYSGMKSENIYDFVNLSGSEIKWNRNLNQFNIITHIKNTPIDKFGRLRGNSYYKEGKWNIQIPSIIFNQKNEDEWDNNIPYLVINSSNVPNDLQTSQISADKLPNTYRNNLGYIQVGDWTTRKEARIRDKWIKIRVRYSGKNLAVIHSLITLFDISYA